MNDDERARTSDDSERPRTSDDAERTNRRGFLSAVGATGALFGAGSVVEAAPFADADNQEVATHYRLGGRISGWQGIEPASIANAVNPTLNLEAGKRYAITWKNVDGAPHNVAIIGDDGDVLLATDIIATQGATQTTRFTASEQMTTYICQVHPNSMKGNIVLGAQAQQQAANQTTTTTTTIPNPTEAPEQETTHPLADEYGENPQKFLAELERPKGVEEDRTGADVEESHPEATGARGRTWFTLHPPNGEPAKLMYSLYLQNVGGVTGATIHLRSQKLNDPVVARLFQPENPTDEIRGTLVDSLLTAGDLRGPFRNTSLLRLVEAIRNDNAYVLVTTEEHPDGVLRGPIRAVAETGGGTTAPEETTAGDRTTTGNQTTTPENETTTGNQTTTDN